MPIVTKCDRRLHQQEIYNESEEAQLEAAIQASLKETVGRSRASFGNTSSGPSEPSDCEPFSDDGSRPSTPDINDVYEDADGLCNGSYEDTAEVDFKQKNGMTSNHDEEDEKEDYKKYLGSEENGSTDIILRYPDGEKEKMTLPSDSKLKVCFLMYENDLTDVYLKQQALFLYISSKGYHKDEYDLVTNFPRRNIHDLNDHDTLTQSNLLKEQIYIHLKSS